MVSAITTHVLDTAGGRPARGVPVRLEAIDSDGNAQTLAEAVTNEDGRVPELGPDEIDAGTFRLTFDTASYFESTSQPTFFPEVALTFRVEDPSQHYHVPVLLSPFALSTYRGS